MWLFEFSCLSNCVNFIKKLNYPFIVLKLHFLSVAKRMKLTILSRLQLAFILHYWVVSIVKKKIRLSCMRTLEVGYIVVVRVKLPIVKSLIVIQNKNIVFNAPLTIYDWGFFYPFSIFFKIWIWLTWHCVFIFAV